MTHSIAVRTACCVLAALFSAALAACDSSSARPDGPVLTGGSAIGSGGVAGGTTGAAGTTGTSTAPSCKPGVSPASPLLTDFSTGASGWHAATREWGLAGNLTGRIFGEVSVNASVDTTHQHLVLSGDATAGVDVGHGGMAFDQCVNTTTYTGVQFALGGTTAGCDVVFRVMTFDQEPSDPGLVGGCIRAAGCFHFPSVKLTSTTGLVTIHFTDLAGGLPAAPSAIASEIVGFLWDFQSPAPVGDGGQLGCAGIALTITNVSFVSN